MRGGCLTWCWCRVIQLCNKSRKQNAEFGGIIIFPLFFAVDSRMLTNLTCSLRMVSGVKTASPRRCHPPSPGSLTASDKVSSACRKRTLVLPNRSCTRTESESRSVSRIRAVMAAIDFEFKCQHLSVRSVTSIPLASKCGIVRDMWLDPVTTNLNGGGGVN